MRARPRANRRRAEPYPRLWTALHPEDAPPGRDWLREPLVHATIAFVASVLVGLLLGR